MASLARSAGLASVRVVGGRYGLGSKDTTPGGILAAFKNGQSEKPLNSFTININDDVTHHSLPVSDVKDKILADLLGDENAL